MACRLCGSTNLAKFLDLGFTPPADGFLRREQLQEPETWYPLEVMLCRACGFIQLSYVVSPEVLYRHDYPYESSTTRAGRLHWEEFATTASRRLGLNPDDLVVDIGSNVGILLEAFRNHGTRILGVDPASNIVRIAEKRGIETLNEFFGHEVAREIVAAKGHAAVVTATNVFAHVNDLRSFMHAINFLLHQQGVFIFEAPYFVNLLNHLEYDTIYHEHLSYLSLKPLVNFFGEFGMEIFDVEERDIHGGSFRVYIGRRGQHPVAPVVGKMIQAEEDQGIYDLAVLNRFAAAVADNRRELRLLLHQLKHQGKRLAAVSAPAKGMTLLNYCRIGTETLDFVTEKSTLKIGRFTPGTHIPVQADAALLEQMPDYALLLAWNFAAEIMDNLAEYRERGGKFIIPIPTPTIV
ncbi:class I SAM-dependent methyltransferase [Desulfurivibrio alkaliphilus]|uniref:C-methyltransferase n=1 Tax=Desulfurivibrio alkaliphilus (strain DSM 19089 / UNIQEM U267 / AHT2) TaxID=589865 RepID=D6YZS7_DESAT|nr:class I SAM-dependent methyltransferase [Desulfurivibrio alkaliphilus]ADH85084.1 C-methyltransferase [Desulfurivibrio alkaliphilus AHT 2]